MIGSNVIINSNKYRNWNFNINVSNLTIKNSMIEFWCLSDIFISTLTINVCRLYSSRKIFITFQMIDHLYFLISSKYKKLNKLKYNIQDYLHFWAPGKALSSREMHYTSNTENEHLRKET